jgi:TRAP-type mannitol/chloroaromatic compound transport system substrate-binding protein
MGGWYRKEITGLADLEGLKMRIAGIAGRVVEKLGVVPQQIPGGDIYPALERGTIDAAEWVGPYDDLKLGFYKVAPYYYYPGFWEGGPCVHFFVNLQKWQELPPAYQAVLTNAAAYANTDMQAKYDARNPAALRELVGGGAKLKTFPAEVIDAAYTAANEIYDEISAENADFKTVIDSVKTFRSEGYLWWQVAEYTYDSFMIRNRTKG